MPLSLTIGSLTCLTLQGITGPFLPPLICPLQSEFCHFVPNKAFSRLNGAGNAQFCAQL